MVALEELLRFRFCTKSVRGYERSVRRLRDFCFTKYCIDLFTSMDCRNTPIERIADRFLSSSWARSWIQPFLAGLLNFTAFADPSADILRRFRDLKHAYMAGGWGDVLSVPGFQRVIQLVPQPTRRSLKQFGDVFLMLTHVFSSIRQIAEHFSASPAEHRRLVKFLSLNSQFEEILKVFLFFDRRILQVGYFTPILSEALVKDWSLFVAVMYETIAGDAQLCAAITRVGTDASNT
jgi:hypothetical protein